MCRVVVVAAILALSVVTAPSARANSVVVPPGSGTLQAAIDAAVPGTTLLLHGGTYSGPITLTKKLTVVRTTTFDDPGAAYIDAGCGSSTAITIAADGVRFAGHAQRIAFPKHCLAPAIVVQGGTTTGVSVSGSSGGQLFGVVVDDTCGRGSGQYDVDIAGSKSMKLLGKSCNFGELNSLRLTGMAPDAKVTIDKVQMHTIVVQDSGSPVLRSGTELHVGLSTTPITLQLVNAGGTSVVRSALSAISIDAASRDNEFILTSADSFTDDGTGDCGSGNTGFTLPPCS